MTDLPSDPYSLDQFFIKPTDDRGHGDKVQARIPPDLARVVEIVARSGKFPYRTSSDFYRDAIWRLAGLLAPKMETYESNTIMSKLRAVEETLKSQEAGENLMRVIDDLGLRLMALDRLDERKKLVGKVRKEFGWVTEDYWRERALRVLKERYGEYLEQ